MQIIITMMDDNRYMGYILVDGKVDRQAIGDTVADIFTILDLHGY